MTNFIDSSGHTLSISCVYYDTDIRIFEKTLESILAAILFAKNQQTLDYCDLYLINNNPEKELIFLECSERYRVNYSDIIIYNGHGNIGYGRANNIAISKTTCTYHLIINPDIIIEPDAISLGVDYLKSNDDVALVAPDVTNADGDVEYLAKRMPTFFIIFLRGLNNNYLNKIFRKTLDRYAYKDKIPSIIPVEIELASGCFMLCRTNALKKVGGFSEKYFLYFEDFDLSKKLSYVGKLFFLPYMKVCHFGGYAAKKGFTHTKLFFSSYFLFRSSFKKT